MARQNSVVCHLFIFSAKPPSPWSAGAANTGVMVPCQTAITLNLLIFFSCCRGMFLHFLITLSVEKSHAIVCLFCYVVSNTIGNIAVTVKHYLLFYN